MKLLVEIEVEQIFGPHIPPRHVVALIAAEVGENFPVGVDDSRDDVEPVAEFRGIRFTLFATGEGS